MSRTVTIKEGGNGASFGPVAKLQTVTDGGYVDWVPERETQLARLSVDKNGTYDAARDDAYGYSEVYVDVDQETDSLSGTGADGNEYNVHKDGGGNVTVDKIPSYIKITTPPDMLIYFDGETIDFTGIVVTAYDAEDQPMGEVPFGELIFPVTEADFSSGEKRIDVDIPDYEDEGTYQVTSIMNGASMAAYAESMLPFPNTMDDSVRLALNVWLAQNSENAIFCEYDTVNPVQPGGSSYGGIRYNAVNVSVGDTINLGDTLSGVSSFGLFYKVESDGTTHFTDYATGTGSNEELFVGATEPNPINTHKPVTVSPFGVTGSGERVNVQAVPVQWPRPGDGNVLEDTFDIDVVPGVDETED